MRNCRDMPRVAERHGNIADEAIALDAPECRAAIAPTELLFAKAQQLGKERQQVIRRGLIACAGEFVVPRTHLLTDITAEDPVAELRPQLARNRAPMLDGPIRDAQPRIES